MAVATNYKLNYPPGQLAPSSINFARKSYRLEATKTINQNESLKCTSFSGNEIFFEGLHIELDRFALHLSEVFEKSA